MHGKLNPCHEVFRCRGLSASRSIRFGRLHCIPFIGESPAWLISPCTYQSHPESTPIHFKPLVTRWVTGSWVTYAMGQMGHGSLIRDPWSTLSWQVLTRLIEVLHTCIPKCVIHPRGSLLVEKYLGNWYAVAPELLESVESVGAIDKVAPCTQFKLGVHAVLLMSGGTMMS